MNLLIYIWRGFQEAAVGVKFQCLSIAAEVFPSQKMYTCIFSETTLSLLLSHPLAVHAPPLFQTSDLYMSTWILDYPRKQSLLSLACWYILSTASYLPLHESHFALPELFLDGSGSFISSKIVSLRKITTPVDQNNALLGIVIFTNQALTVSRISLPVE